MGFGIDNPPIVLVHWIADALPSDYRGIYVRIELKAMRRLIRTGMVVAIFDVVSKQ